MNTNNDLAFALDVDINEETLIALTSVVDQLDDLHMISNGVVFNPTPDMTLETYILRATRYLDYLLDQLQENNPRQLSTDPLGEATRNRIARVLRSSMEPW